MCTFATMGETGQSKPGRFDFIGWRQVISDRTWFGMGMVAIGVGVATEERGWAWLLLLVALAGIAMIVSGVRRAVLRPREAGQDGPRPPF